MCLFVVVVILLCKLVDAPSLTISLALARSLCHVAGLARSFYLRACISSLFNLLET